MLYPGNRTSESTGSTHFVAKASTLTICRSFERLVKIIDFGSSPFGFSKTISRRRASLGKRLVDLSSRSTPPWCRRFSRGL
jgi:hypothetical protein